MGSMSSVLGEDRNKITDELKRAAAGEEVGDVARLAVHLLRSTSYSLSQFLDDCGAVKEKLRQEAACDAALEPWRRIDRVIEEALRATSCVHETVLETCARGYAELRGDGTVVYANQALRELSPDLIGRKLAEQFVESRDIEGALTTDSRVGPFRLTLRGEADEIPVNVEIGAIGTVSDSLSHYAIIGDMRAYLSAQIAGFEAAPFGVAQLDRAGVVRFVNRAGCRELGTSSLVGSQAEQLVGLADRPRLRASIETMAVTHGGFDGEFELCVPGRGAAPVRVSVVPQFDPQHRQMGPLVFFRSLARERARSEIYQACERYHEPEALIENVFRILKSVIPFDQATFGVYSEQMKYYRMLLACPEVRSGDVTRWFEAPAEFADWILCDEPWAGDLEEFFNRFQSGPEQRQHPLVQGLIESGIRSFISLPVRQNSEVTTVLSLLSRNPGQYGPMDFQLLKTLPVEQALRMAREGRQQKLDRFVREMLNEFAATKSHRELAKLLVERLAEMFDWDHVSLFKVNRLQQQFELLEQVSRASDHFLLPVDYQQPITEGLMGEALRRPKQQYLTIDDTKKLPLPYRYISLYKDARSSLCLPIRLDGTISWMLNIEEAATHAFHGTDLDAVLYVVDELTRTLDRLFQATLTENILDLTDQGAVVVDAVGQIRNVNQAAQALLGGTKSALERCSFVKFAMPEYEDILAERSMTVERHIVIKDLQGHARPVIASLRLPGEDYDHKIWLLTDTVQQDWNVERRYLRAVVNDVAQQTRVPLMIATRLVDRVRSQADHTVLSDACDKALKHLAKADITYERLIGGLVNKRRPEEVRAPFDVGHVLKSVLDQLPQEDREQIEAAVEGNPVAIADHKTIEFVLRSVIHYLLRKKALDRAVEIKVATKQKWVHLHMSAGEKWTSAAVKAKDSLTKYEEEAKTAVALAPDTLRAAIKAQGGRVTLPDANGPMTSSVIRLPAAIANQGARA